jgi:hypothetical protein
MTRERVLVFDFQATMLGSARVLHKTREQRRREGGSEQRKKQKTAKEKLGFESMLTMFPQFPESTERGSLVALSFFFCP